jgi:predicted small metal-binding protein
MAKVLCCRDMSLDAEGEIRAETAEEMLRQAVAQAQTTHNMQDMSPEVVENVRAAIRDEEAWQGRLTAAREALEQGWDLGARQMRWPLTPFKP